MNVRQSRNGSTVLVIILVVFALGFIMFVGLLLAIAVPNFINAKARAHTARAMAEMRSLANAVESYHIDNQQYPPSLYALTTPIRYIVKVPNDPFYTGEGEAMYRHFTGEDYMVIASIGPDKVSDMPQVATGQDPRPSLLYYHPSNGLRSSGDVIEVVTSSQPSPGRR